MAYLGTPPRVKVLTSADIAEGAVTLSDISFTDQPASMNISGNIDKHTMRLADQVVVNGDLDISDNLILSKISDDGNAIILTNDSSTRTITGTGSLEASTLTQTPNASLTGMTGELGSAVTVSPNLNLDNATFPSGHVLQTVYQHYDGTVTLGATDSCFIVNSVAITLKTLNPKLLITATSGEFDYTSGRIHMSVVYSNYALSQGASTNIGLEITNGSSTHNTGTSLLCGEIGRGIDSGYPNVGERHYPSATGQWLKDFTGAVGSTWYFGFTMKMGITGSNDYARVGNGQKPQISVQEIQA